MSADRKLKGLIHWVAGRDHVTHKLARNRVAQLNDEQLRALKQERVKAREAGQKDKNYETACCVCGQKPTVRDTELCGPCCFGEADTAGGNW